MTKTKKEIDYYGTDDNYIHLKWGDCVKMYNFTDEFRAEYPEFTERYTHYWENGGSKQASFDNKGFKNAFEVIAYIYKKDIPVHLYFNFTDEPVVGGYDEVIAYLVRENTYIPKE